MATIVLRKGPIDPTAPFDRVAEPGIVLDPARPRLYAQIDPPPALPVVLADPVDVAELRALVLALEARLAILERDAWTRPPPPWPIP